MWFLRPRRPAISIIVVVYNMAREAPRTLFSLSASYQRDVDAGDYEIIVVDNGSTPAFDPAAFGQLKGNFRLIRIDRATPSPVQAINRGLAEAKGKLIGVMIDGARMASPGMIRRAAMADKLAERAVILTLSFHLGSQVQMESVPKGYDKEQEDRLLEQSGWMEDGYRLFDISVLAGSSAGGWLRPIAESNAIFMRKALWVELGGYDERFQTPGGGYANLDTFARAVMLPGISAVTLLGEGTFHQVHGGIATNAAHDVHGAFQAEYMNIRGRPFQAPVYQSLYLGSMPANTAQSTGDSATTKSQREPLQDAALHLAHANASRSTGDTEAAAAAYRAALTCDNDLVEAHIGLCELRMPGDGYLTWLARLQEAQQPKTYLEIGIGSGKSLALTRPPTRSIGIDRQPTISVPLTSLTRIFCETSDDFFANNRLGPLLAGDPVSLAFIDGGHVFAQALKDFMHVEAFCGGHSLVLMHDTVPFDEVTQRPDRQRKFYTGDVWKTVLCLRHYRPDLDIFTVATPWTGLTVITGLEPASRVLYDCYDDAVKKFTDLSFKDFEPRLNDALNLVPNDWEAVKKRLEAKGIIQPA